MNNNEFIAVVNLCNPADETQTAQYTFRCEYSHNDDTYGNGYYLAIYYENGLLFRLFDLRYNLKFDPDRKDDFLAVVVFDSIWTGENGSYEIQDITLKPAINGDKLYG